MANGEYSAETRLARVEQRVADLDTRVTAMVAVTASVIQLTERVETVRRDIGGYAGKLEAEIETREQREAEQRRESRETRRAMWLLTATIIAALITAAAVILTSSVH
jgi:hypothetical protein